MGANIWFWLLYVITLIFGVWGMNPWRPAGSPYAPFGGWLILFILIGILGLHDFGAPFVDAPGTDGPIEPMQPLDTGQPRICKGC